MSTAGRRRCLDAESNATVTEQLPRTRWIKLSKDFGPELGNDRYRNRTYAPIAKLRLTGPFHKIRY